MQRCVVRRGLCVLALIPITFLLFGPAAERARSGEVVEARPREIREVDLRRYLAWLAGDELQGREAGTAGARLAGATIASVFERAGLEAAGTEGYFQPFPLFRPVLSDGNFLRVNASDGEVLELAVEKDYNPFSASPTKEAQGGVVFAGYGITAPKRAWTDAHGVEHMGWDDYEGLDVEGKLVLVLRKDPGWKDARVAAFRAKLANAVRHGAVALLLVNDTSSLGKGGGGGPDAGDGIAHWSAPSGIPSKAARIPFVFLHRRVADEILALGGLDDDLLLLERRVKDEGPAPRVVDGVEVQLRTALGRREVAKARNVAGLLRGSDPSVAQEIVVVGAHYDHLGLGNFGSLGGKAARGKIHPGADDNASGTAALLELVDFLAVSPPRRSVLFLSFSAEEKGLLGSRYFVAHPTISLGDVVCMINLDMIGRGADHKLHVGGVGTGQGLRGVVEDAEGARDFKISWGVGGAAPTDSSSFFRKKIPVLFFFTGLHGDYHRPTDTSGRIEVGALAEITRLVADVVRRLGDRDERLVYTEPPRPPQPLRLGIQANADPSGKGIAVVGVQEGGAARKAGLLAGDVLVGVDGHAVRNLKELRDVLGHLEAGKPVSIEVLRAEKRVVLEIVPTRAGRR